MVVYMSRDETVVINNFLHTVHVYMTYQLPYLPGTLPEPSLSWPLNAWTPSGSLELTLLGSGASSTRRPFSPLGRHLMTASADTCIWLVCELSGR